MAHLPALIQAALDRLRSTLLCNKESLRCVVTGKSVHISNTQHNFDTLTVQAQTKKQTVVLKGFRSLNNRHTWRPFPCSELKKHVNAAPPPT